MESNLEGIETLRIVRADGNLRISGAASVTELSRDAEVTRDGGLAEVRLRSNASVTVAPGVTVEVLDVAGNLEVRELAAPLTLEKVRGNFNASRLGAVSIRSRVAGNAHLEHSGAIEAEQISGNLTAEDVKSIHITQVASGVECGVVTGDIAIEKIAGGARLYEVRGKITSRLVAGSLEVADTSTVEVSVVGGKVRATQINGNLAFGKIGGKFVADGVTGDVAAGFVGGRASITRADSKIELFDVSGAAEVHSDFKPGTTCTVKSRGRINVEIAGEPSFAIAASAGWGKVRLYGIDTAGLQWTGRARIEGTVGAQPENAERARLELDTTSADIIIATASAERRDYYGREGFGRGFEDFASDLGKEIPEFVGSILDAVGKFVSDSGGRSGHFVRDVTRDLTRGVREALSELERTMSDLGNRVPNDIKEQLAKLGRDLAELLRQATAAGSSITREERRELREKIRRAVHEMRDALREAARAARPRSTGASDKAGNSGNSQSSKADEHDIPRPGATVKLSRDEAILQILRAVKEGRLEPEEADDLINAWNREPGDARTS